MLDHLTDADLSSDIQPLREKAFEQMYLVASIKSCEFVENVSNFGRHLKVPYWLYTSYLLLCLMPYLFGRYIPRSIDAMNYSGEL